MQQMEDKPWTKSEFFAWNDGRRIVDLYELSKQLLCKQCSSVLDLRRTEREARYGLASVLYVLCDCGMMNDVHTGRLQHDGGYKKSPQPMYEVNIKASINLLMYGVGASRILSFLALLDIPVPPPDDTSLIVPVTQDAEMLSESTTLPPTSTASTMPATTQQDLPPVSETLSFQKSLSSPFVSDIGVGSVPHSHSHSHPLPSSSREGGGGGGGNDTDNVITMPAAATEDQKGVNNVQSEHTNIVRDESDDDEEGGGNDGEEDDNDDEYLPPSKSRSRAKAKLVKLAPSPKKPVLRGPRSARVKQTAKVVIRKHAENFQIKREQAEEIPEENCSDTDSTGDNHNENGQEDKDFTNPAEWSSTESEAEAESPKAKDSECSLSEEEDEETVKEEPKRKRGRPKGSADKKKRTRRGMRSEPAPKKSKETNEERELPTCTTCRKEFNSVKGYNLHMRRVHNKEIKERIELDSLILFVCAFCNMPYAKEHRIVSHLDLKHWSPTAKKTEMFYKLPVTDFIKETLSSACHKTLRYVCLHCDNQGMTRKTTGEHICISPEGSASCVIKCPEGKKLTQQDGSNLFHVSERCSLCYMCGAQFSDTVGLEHHLLSVHGQASGKLLQHKCQDCGAMFPCHSRLQKHRAAKHTVGPRPNAYICDFCGKAYPSKNTMFRHRQLKHISGVRFQCEYCPKKFFKRHQWIIHTKRHLGQAPHQCQVCGKDFSCKYNLKTHERIHTGEKPYQCKLCDAAFAQKTSLDVHMKKHR